MKRVLIALFGLIILAAAGVLTVPGLRDEIRWRLAVRADSAAAYDGYVRSWPSGRHAGVAWQRFDERRWQDAHEADQIDAYTAYLRDLPSGAHAAAAATRIEELRWTHATAPPSVSMAPSTRCTPPGPKPVSGAPSLPRTTVIASFPADVSPLSTTCPDGSSAS